MNISAICLAVQAVALLIQVWMMYSIHKITMAEKKKLLDLKEQVCSEALIAVDHINAAAASIISKGVSIPIPPLATPTSLDPNRATARKKRNYYTYEMISACKLMSKRGSSYKEISKVLKISKATISRYVNMDEYENGYTPDNTPKKGVVSE